MKNYIVSTNSLTEQQYDNLVQIAANNDDCDVFYSYDSYTFDCFFLAYENNELVAFLSIMQLEDSNEITAFTLPGHRRMGYFSQLLSAAHTANPKLSLCGVIDEKCALNNSRFAKHPLKNDYFMQISQADYKAARYAMHHFRCYKRSFGYKYTLSLNTERIGVANINIGSSFNTLWGVEIKEPYRNQGYGSKLIKYLISDYFRKCDDDLYLHVEGDNISAVKLYTSCGFSIAQTISYYQF